MHLHRRNGVSIRHRLSWQVAVPPQKTSVGACTHAWVFSGGLGAWQSEEWASAVNFELRGWNLP
eukprot:1185001-Pleurochrysis_carterae.AAC.1